MAKEPKKEPAKSKRSPGRPRKHPLGDADSDRSGASIHVYIDPAVNDALVEYIESLTFRPSKTAVLELSLREYLKTQGFWPPVAKTD